MTATATAIVTTDSRMVVFVDVDVDVDASRPPPRVVAGDRRRAHRRPRRRIFRVSVSGSGSVFAVHLAVPPDALHEDAQSAVHQELEPVAVHDRVVEQIERSFGIFPSSPRGVSIARRRRRNKALFRLEARARLRGAAPRDGHRRRRCRARTAEVLKRETVHGPHGPDQTAVDARETTRDARRAQRRAAQFERRAEGGKRVRDAREPPREHIRTVRARALAGKREKVLGFAPVAPAEVVAGSGDEGSPARPRYGAPFGVFFRVFGVFGVFASARGFVRTRLEPAAGDVRQPHAVRADGALQPQAEPARVARVDDARFGHVHAIVSSPPRDAVD